jgi:4-hydroxy-tetrahydrodipicolinate reductase
MTIKVGVVGASGRMGRTTCAAVEADPDLELVAAVSPRNAGVLKQLADAKAEVAIDFTVADAARITLPWLAMHGMHAVVGTTGFDEADIDNFRSVFTGSNCVIASNFSISAVLMMRFAEMAAPYFETAEIIELHHDKKIDAPSGTAVSTAKRMAAASAEWAADPTQKLAFEGARGGQGPGGIHIHSVRLRGLQAHQEVIFGSVGQSLTIRQDSYDNSSYMPGVLFACKAIQSAPGLTIGLEPLMNL